MRRDEDPEGGENIRKKIMKRREVDYAAAFFVFLRPTLGPL